jgi:hypothetical protein
VVGRYIRIKVIIRTVEREGREGKEGSEEKGEKGDTKFGGRGI